MLCASWRCDSGKFIMVSWYSSGVDWSGTRQRVHRPPVCMEGRGRVRAGPAGAIIRAEPRTRWRRSHCCRAHPPMQPADSAATGAALLGRSSPPALQELTR
eukprot:gene13818-biopygen4865